ncbi:hypothetical protein [Nonomuraea sp. NPDC049158]|uniref:hypothetical protein n=1 Tax=Nonomuraea sp. NPDC049158 TaxID=3155649 RepID=UPI0033D5E605
MISPQTRQLYRVFRAVGVKDAWNRLPKAILNAPPSELDDGAAPSPHGKGQFGKRPQEPPTTITASPELTMTLLRAIRNSGRLTPKKFPHVTPNAEESP